MARILPLLLSLILGAMSLAVSLDCLAKNTDDLNAMPAKSTDATPQQDPQPDELDAESTGSEPNEEELREREANRANAAKENSANPAQDEAEQAPNADDSALAKDSSTESKENVSKTNVPNAQFVSPSSRYLPEAEIRQITINKQPFELLVRPWEGRKKRGVAIILPATNGTADAPGVMAFVRRNINAAGWASLSLTPPTEPPTPNFATPAAEVASAGVSQLTTPSNKPTQRISPEISSKQLLEQEAFLIKSISQLGAVGKNYPGKRVLITADKSAELLITLLSEQRILSPDVLVVVNPYSEDERRNLALAEKLAKLRIPILDIQSPDGHPLSRETAAKRKALALTYDTPKYRQILLDLSLDNESAWQDCLGAIKGFSAKMSGAL